MTNIKKSSSPMGEQMKDEGVSRTMRVNLDGEFFDVEATTPEEAEIKAKKARDIREKDMMEMSEKKDEQEKEGEEQEKQPEQEDVEKTGD